MRSSTRTRPSPLLLTFLVILAFSVGLADRASSQVSTSCYRSAEPTTVYLYRHAERASETDRDPSLSELGRRRAEALADALVDSGISAIYVTQYRRTGETAAPLADRIGIEMHSENAGGEDAVRTLAASVLRDHRGASVLVVGHSNTIPALVHAFGGPEMEEFEASRYGDLFILTIPDRGPIHVVKARVDPRPAR